MECELLWPPRVTMACRLEEIPRPGDFVEYENLGQSARGQGERRRGEGLPHACRHPGVKLLGRPGQYPQSLHLTVPRVCGGWTATTRFLYQPDLSDVNRDPADLRLAECRMEIWGGWASDQLRRQGPPAPESIEPLVQPPRRRLEGQSLPRPVVATARLPVNWKLAMEAFMEGYHVMGTHLSCSAGLARSPSTEVATVRRRTRPAVQCRADRRFTPVHRPADPFHAAVECGNGSA